MSQNAHYDRYCRDPRSRTFYNSAAWKRCRDAKIAATPWCEYIAPGKSDPCGSAAEHIHHITPIETSAGWEQRLDPDGLQSVCISCHNRAEADEPPIPVVTGMLDLVEDETYYFDPDAAERPIRFIEKFCIHYEGTFVGQPFTLAPIQKQIVRDVYGWKCRDTGLRRFAQVWFEAAAGAGKSPLLAALGLYGLIADNEAGAQVYSVASNYSQAKVIFETAKKFIEQSPPLTARLKITQYEITYRATKSTWRIISGKGPKAGLRPSLVLGDEVHEWPTREVYDSLQGRMTKRAQPIFWCATNAGESKQTLCYQLHEEAVAVLADPTRNPKLYPILWAAQANAKIDDAEGWKAANPLIGITIKEPKIREECNRAKGIPALETRFKRLYMGHWCQSANKWLSSDIYTASVAPIDMEVIRGKPLYVGIDLSQGDDLCATVWIWTLPDRFYLDAHFYLPRETAERYERKDQTPYSKWEKAGWITLLEEPTISAAARRLIALDVLEKKKDYELIAVCYDRYKSDDCIARLESEGVKCLPIAQGYSVSPGCHELERRLKEKSVIIAPNGVLQAHAEVVEIKQDDRGNIWPVKPHARGQYAGLRSSKIDGIAAAVTAMTEARKHNFPVASQKWTGTIEII